MIDLADIRKIVSHMDVVDCDGVHVGTVDGLEIDSLKLSKFDKSAGGTHHWVPFDWIASVDQHVKLDRTRDELMRTWLTEQRA